MKFLVKGMEMWLAVQTRMSFGHTNRSTLDEYVEWV